MEEMKNDLRETLRLAKEAGIREDGIMTDPGVGFAVSNVRLPILIFLLLLCCL